MVPDFNGTCEPLAWLPATCASLALRLAALDAAIMYRNNVPPARETLHVYKYIQRPVVPDCQHQTSPSITAGTVETAGYRRGGERQVVSGDPIGFGGQVIASVLPAFPQNLAMTKEQQEFSIKVRLSADRCP